MLAQLVLLLFLFILSTIASLIYFLRGEQNQNLALKRIRFHIAAATLNTAEKGAESLLWSQVGLRVGQATKEGCDSYS